MSRQESTRNKYAPESHMLNSNFPVYGTATVNAWSSKAFVDGLSPGETRSISKRNLARPCTSSAPKSSGSRSARYATNPPCPAGSLSCSSISSRCSLLTSSLGIPKVPSGKSGSFVASSNICPGLANASYARMVEKVNVTETYQAP